MSYIRPSDPRAEGAFEALVKAACTDREAATGLALAYGDLPVTARGRVLDLLSVDRRPPTETRHLLALLSGVEEHPALRRRLEGALRPRDAALHWGDGRIGGLLIVRPRPAGAELRVRVTWAGDALDVEVEEGPASSPSEWPARFGLPPDRRPADADRALDELASRLWAARQRGERLPDALLRAADLFDRAR
ncbi:MAG: hypothetical protein ACFCGT_14165 [Sandaracinaceae bacterium]